MSNGISIVKGILWVLVWFGFMIFYTVLDILIWRKIAPEQSRFLNLITVAICMAIFLNLLVTKTNFKLRLFSNISFLGIVLALGCSVLFYFLLDKGLDPLFEDLFPSSKENYQQIFSKLGVKEDSEVLVYGFTMPDQGFGDEGRILYTFNYAGFDNVKIIDGGFKQVESLGFNKKYNPSEDRIDVSDVVRVEGENNSNAIFTDELLTLVGNENVQIIDTRLEVEYNGRVIYGENKAGHIPTAISIPFNSLVDKDGFIKSREELEKYFEDKGLDKNKLQITYCTTGVRASYVAVILTELGYKVRNYEPSFARYANVAEVE